MRVRQRAVALYFIDKLALRAGNEKDEDQADTVGCCSLRVEHITLHEEKDGESDGCSTILGFSIWDFRMKKVIGPHSNSFAYVYRVSKWLALGCAMSSLHLGPVHAV